eukprot:10608911-Alexandrium_andersonii.AAC.1
MQRGARRGLLVFSTGRTRALQCARPFRLLRGKQSRAPERLSSCRIAGCCVAQKRAPHSFGSPPRE